MITTNRIKMASAASILAFVFVQLTGCAGPDSSTEGRNRGAAAGAVVGLTMGALTGDARLAAAGAVAGGVTGGAAGAMRDYEEDRADYRAETLAGAIGSKDSGGQGEAPANWDQIDAFIGNWNVSMWGLNDQGQRIDATARAVSSLDNTRSVTFRFSDFKSDQFDAVVEGSSRLSFDPSRGFELLNQFSSSADGNRWVGHYDNQAGKYVFFYAGSDQQTFSGIQRSDYRVEMRMVGNDVITIETFATVGTDEKRIQSYRLTRS